MLFLVDTKWHRLINNMNSPEDASISYNWQNESNKLIKEWMKCNALK